jgi:hypothetical protein
MSPFKLPNDNDVLSLKDIIKHGPTIITAALIDLFNPYHDMAQQLSRSVKGHFARVYGAVRKWSTQQIHRVG